MALNSFEKGECISSSEKEQWTVGYVIDELTFQLSSTSSYLIDDKTGIIRISHKYHDRAEWILYRLNVWRPPPVFVINLSDLTDRLNKELKKMTAYPEALNEVVVHAIGRILESVDERYYHLNGVSVRIRWRFEP